MSFSIPNENWSLLGEKHYLDNFDRKKYNEYCLQSKNGTDIMLLLCDFYEKKKVYIQVIYDYNGKKIYGGYSGMSTKLGYKQIKKICDKNIELHVNEFEIKDIEGFNNKDKLLNETVIREMIDYFYNKKIDQL